MKVFMSYTRSDAAIAAKVADQIRGMQHTIWYDREVMGGQAWWDAILRQIRQCDAFIFILTPKSLDSKACRSECNYADQLRRRILPVLCADGVKESLLPPELSKIQYVDYRPRDVQVGIALFMALDAVPEGVPLPEPLPPEPEIPISYLGDLRVQIDSIEKLPAAKQFDLLYEVKRRLKDQEARDDAVDLLHKLRDQPGLYAEVRDEIDALPEIRHAPRNHEAPGNNSLVVRNGDGDAPSKNIDLTGDTTSLEGLIHGVATGGETWVLSAGKDSVCVAVENDMLVLTAIFVRWMGGDVKRLKALGWTTAGSGVQNAAAAALGALGIATNGLAFGVLLHKGTRDYLNRRVMVKQFTLAQRKEAARSVVEAFQTLAPGATEVVASKVETPQLQPALSQ